MTLTLNKETSIEALLVDSLNISHGSLKLPNEWTRYRGNWCDMIPQDSPVEAQLLIGSDTPRLHPRDALDQHGRLIETKSARLKISILTGKYMLHGYSTREKVQIVTLEEGGQPQEKSICEIDLVNDEESESRDMDDAEDTSARMMGDGEEGPRLEVDSIPIRVVEALIHTPSDSSSRASSRSSLLPPIVHNAQEDMETTCLENPNEIQIVNVESGAEEEYGEL